ncbi:MAG: hypothetical protein ABI779_11430 [Acidobacteriota bacterium]
MSATSRTLLLATLLASGLWPATPARAQVQPADVITVATVSGSSDAVVDVPVYIRDTAGTPLGIDQPPGSRVQSYSIRVTYAPGAAVQAITFTRAGITLPLTPTFESSPAVPGSSIALLGNFDEATNLIPFTSNAPLPGDQVAHLLVTLSPSVAPGTVITLTLDPALTQLTDEGGTPLATESVANGRLRLVSGAIAVPSPVPALSTWMLALLAASLAVVAVSVRIQ